MCVCVSFGGTGSPDGGETERGGNGGSGFSLLALTWPSFESKRSGEEEMCFASKKKKKERDREEEKKGKSSIWC